MFLIAKLLSFIISMIKTIFKFTSLPFANAASTFKPLHMSPVALKGRVVYGFSSSEGGSNVEG
jgi:hypothetical protein